MDDKIQLWIKNNPVKTIIIAGAFMHILVAILYQHTTLYPDSLGYVDLAIRIINFDLNGYNGERSPGYPLLLAIANISYPLVVVLQSSIGILSLILAYKIAIRTGVSNKTSLFITLALTCYIPTIFFDFAILTESLTLFVIMSIFFLYFSIISKKEKPIFNYLIICACSILILIKPFYIYLPFLLFIFLFFSYIPVIKVISKYIYIILIPTALFLGWSYVNKTNTGYFTSTTLSGFNLSQTCVKFAEKTTPEYADIGYIYAKYRDEVYSDKELAMTIWVAEPELREKTGLSFPDLSHELYKYSIETIKLNPLDYIKQVFVSWCDFWKTSLYWEYESVTIPYADNIILYICYVERIILQLIKIFFVLAIPYNIVMAFRKRNITPPTAISIVVLVASVLQAMVTYGTNSRFSFPFEMLIVLSFAINIITYRKEKLKQSQNEGLQPK